MIHHSENLTTIRRGQCTVTVICDTINPRHERIITLELVYPRYIHSELMTHRAFSRNASSSRATPLSVTISEVMNDPVFFDYVGKNQKGMVAGEALEDNELEEFKKDWFALGKEVAEKVQEMSNKYGIHKQTLNRALEPWLRIRTLVTATDWNNFFDLRLKEDAQPEIRNLARCILACMASGDPQRSGSHLPYITDEDFMYAVQNNFDDLLEKISVARCARVSYGRLDGKENSYKDDLELYDKLLSSGHLSPFEHVAYMQGGHNANLTGWISLRTILGR